MGNFPTGKLFDPAMWRESCPMGDCPWACGVRFHMCKVVNKHQSHSQSQLLVQATDHASICQNYRPPDALDWLRRLAGPGQQPAQEEEKEEEEETAQEKFSVTAEARGKKPPQHNLLLESPCSCIF